MKKFFIGLFCFALIFALAGTVVLAKGPNGPAGKSDVAHLSFYEKNPADWSVVDGGAFGKMTYTLGEDYIFNGHGLMPNTEYTLINYQGWPGPVLCFGNAESNNGGNVHIAGIMPAKENLAKDSTDTLDGAKVWLVPSDDVNCASGMIAWNPESYLFEDDVISLD